MLFCSQKEMWTYRCLVFWWFISILDSLLLSNEMEIKTWSKNMYCSPSENLILTCLSCVVSCGIRNSGILMKQDSSHMQHQFMNSTSLVYPQWTSTALQGFLHIQSDKNHLMMFLYKCILITDIRTKYLAQYIQIPMLNQTHT